MNASANEGVQYAWPISAHESLPPSAAETMRRSLPRVPRQYSSVSPWMYTAAQYDSYA